MVQPPAPAIVPVIQQSIEESESVFEGDETEDLQEKGALEAAAAPPPPPPQLMENEDPLVAAIARRAKKMAEAESGGGGAEIEEKIAQNTEKSAQNSEKIVQNSGEKSAQNSEKSAQNDTPDVTTQIAKPPGFTLRFNEAVEIVGAEEGLAAVLKDEGEVGCFYLFFIIIIIIIIIIFFA
jgi:hypothetical protein